MQFEGVWFFKLSVWKSMAFCTGSVYNSDDNMGNFWKFEKKKFF